MDPHILGFLNLTGLAAPAARGTDSNADAIAKQIAAIATANHVLPTGVVMNPINWLTIQLSKSSQGEYLSGQTPFIAPPVRTLWSLPVAVTPAMPAGEALVGCFQQFSQIFDRGGIRIDFSNSHQDCFTKNLMACRSEERLALAVYRESAFGLVTALT